MRVARYFAAGMLSLLTAACTRYTYVDTFGKDIVFYSNETDLELIIQPIIYYKVKNNFFYFPEEVYSGTEVGHTCSGILSIRDKISGTTTVFNAPKESLHWSTYGPYGEPYHGDWENGVRKPPETQVVTENRDFLFFWVRPVGGKYGSGAYGPMYFSFNRGKSFEYVWHDEDRPPEVVIETPKDVTLIYGVEITAGALKSRHNGFKLAVFKKMPDGTLSYNKSKVNTSQLEWDSGIEIEEFNDSSRRWISFLAKTRYARYEGVDFSIPAGRKMRFRSDLTPDWYVIDLPKDFRPKTLSCKSIYYEDISKG